MEATANKTLPPTAALDLGSNSFRLLIGQVNENGIISLVKELVTVRLSQGLEKSGFLAPEAIRSGLEALTAFRRQLDKFGVKSCTCCGTEALRQAKNSREFISKAVAILGCEIDVVSGIREASLSSSGALSGLHGSVSLPVFIVDVGGGSTEISYLSQGAPLQSLSLPAGAVSLSEIEIPYPNKNFVILQKQLGEFLATLSGWHHAAMVSTGGTATTLAMLDLQLNSYDENKVHGHTLKTAAIDRLATDLAEISSAERNKLPGLEDGRGEIILAGCKIYQEIIATIGVDGMIVSDWGLLEGILLDKNVS